ncbi:MAG: histidinol-phosphatase HisJ family protein [Holdemanella sp.]|nr:histidinol-phosphatase HisJ family protein [Holdemanella sp.]
MQADYHVHSYHSDDSTTPIEEIVLKAKEIGLNEFALTDHVDYGIKKDYGESDYTYLFGEPRVNVDYPVYFKELDDLQKKYPEISIKKGLEFGIQYHTIDKYNKLFNSYPFDFIILSIHQVDDLEFWTQEYQKDKTQQEYIEGYYNEMYKVVSNYTNYSVLGHMDLIVRYDKQGKYPFEKVKPIIEKILRKVIQDGKGIEINTSSRQYGLDDLTPSRAILKLYKELGGTILTIGSDSHKTETLGTDLDYTKKELLKLGFETYCTFDCMKPIFHNLKED